MEPDLTQGTVFLSMHDEMVDFMAKETIKLGFMTRLSSWPTSVVGKLILYYNMKVIINNCWGIFYWLF